MTGPERLELKIFFDFVRDWRREDERWKTGMDERMRKVEVFVAAETTEEQIVTAAGISQRARRTLIVAALGVAATVVIGIVNVVRDLT